MRTRSLMLLGLALACGLVASIGISQFMDARSNAPESGERQSVFVALLDIKPNEELTAQNIKLEEWPKKIVPTGALTKLEEVEGKRSRIKLYAGEPILASKLLGADDLTGAAKDIPPGFRVAHVKVDSVAGASNLILPGDRVDVLVFRQPNNDTSAIAAKIVLQDIKVFAVDTQTETQFVANKDEQTEPTTARSISLLVTPQQSVILHAASEMGGSLRLILRSPDDDAHVASEGATIDDVFGPDTKSNRNAEKGAKTDEKEGDDITSWLTQQKDKSPTSAAKTSALPATPLPPVPPLPTPTRKMLVMYGSQLVQVEIPLNGEPPLNQPESNASGSGGMGDQGGGVSSSPLMGGGSSPLPPGLGAGGDQEDTGSDDSDSDDSEGSGS